MSSTPQWKLRRLAPRAKRVLERRSAESTVLATFQSTLPAKANAFIAAYDATAKYENAWRREMAEGKGAVAALVKDVRSWLPLLVRDVPGFDPSTFGDNPDVPDDVLEDAGRLVEFLEEATYAQGKPLSYANDASAALTTSLTSANKEWSEAEEADSKYQGLLKNVRATAAVFDKEIQAFRLSLSRAVGRTDKDFQKLRVEKAGQQDDEDDPTAPKAPIEVAPAGEGTK